MLLKIPYADGEPPDKQRTFLVINIDKEVVELLNVSSIRDKEIKASWPSNEILKEYRPPFKRPSFVKLDSLYRIELFEELNYLILAGGQPLDPGELKRIREKFQKYRNEYHINIAFYDKADIEKYNSIYIAERISASAEDLI
ncbi:hypothetical protein D2962_09355 [Biomaibacter acetigenes]|uniref:Uncharacterized protein n=1 Tax=Biomaibacter acetigenes TaxID=2316383 RepID=A0A3G2R7J5_9FIRM|nr:hypothetical protein [Biomaibacter acetigenes]AYO30787.1 hypothetical protein D2962_09355 [Biomaibacter acetigenes]